MIKSTHYNTYTYLEKTPSIHVASLSSLLLHIINLFCCLFLIGWFCLMIGFYCLAHAGLELTGRSGWLGISKKPVHSYPIRASFYLGNYMVSLWLELQFLVTLNSYCSITYCCELIFASDTCAEYPMLVFHACVM